MMTDVCVRSSVWVGGWVSVPCRPLASIKNTIRHFQGASQNQSLKLSWCVTMWKEKRRQQGDSVQLQLTVQRLQFEIELVIILATWQAILQSRLSLFLHVPPLLMPYLHICCNNPAPLIIWQPTISLKPTISTLWSTHSRTAGQSYPVQNNMRCSWRFTLLTFQVPGFVIWWRK